MNVDSTGKITKVDMKNIESVPSERSYVESIVNLIDFKKFFGT